MPPNLKLAAAAVAGCLALPLILIAWHYVQRRIIRARGRRFVVDRVVTEEVAVFRVKGCRTCGGRGMVKRAPPGQRDRVWMPCACASKRFLDQFRQDTKMLGPYRVWKRGRRPPTDELARRATRRATG
jgi:hypothetical protein